MFWLFHKHPLSRRMGLNAFVVPLCIIEPALGGMPALYRCDI